MEGGLSAGVMNLRTLRGQGAPVPSLVGRGTACATQGPATLSSWWGMVNGKLPSHHISFPTFIPLMFLRTQMYYKKGHSVETWERKALETF